MLYNVTHNLITKRSKNMFTFTNKTLAILCTFVILSTVSTAQNASTKTVSTIANNTVNYTQNKFGAQNGL